MSELIARNIGSTVAYDQVATILDGQTLSNFCDVGGFKLTGLLVPQVLEGAILKFKMSPYDVNQTANKGTMTQDDGTTYSVTVQYPDVGDQFVYIELPIVKFAGIKYIAIETDTAPVGADAPIVLSLSLI